MVRIMQINNDTITTLNEFMAILGQSIKPEFLNIIKNKFFEYLSKILGKKIKKMEIGIVVDTNQVLKAISYHAVKGKESWLEKLLKNPMLNIRAPPKLIEEAEVKIEKFVKQNVPLKKLRAIWDGLKYKIKICESSIYSNILAKILMNNRDINDVPFVALYIDTGSSVIATEDKDITDQQEIHTSTLTKLGDLHMILERGLISFVLINEIIPITTKFLLSILFCVIEIIWNFLQSFYNILESIRQKILEKVNIDEMIMGLLISLGILTTLSVISKEFRKTVLEVLKQICTNLKPIIEWTINTLKNIINNIFTWLNKIMPYLKVGLLILRIWIYNYTQMINKLEQFNIIS